MNTFYYYPYTSYYYHPSYDYQTFNPYIIYTNNYNDCNDCKACSLENYVKQQEMLTKKIEPQEVKKKNSCWCF